MLWSGRLPRWLMTVGVVGGGIAVGVAWWLAATYIANISAGPQLLCRLRNMPLFSNLGLLLWELGSMLVFPLAGAGLLTLLARGTNRGRRARLISAGVCVLLLVLSTWGYVVATHAVMRYTDGHGAHNGLPVDAQGLLHDPCLG